MNQSVTGHRVQRLPRGGLPSRLRYRADDVDYSPCSLIRRPLTTRSSDRNVPDAQNLARALNGPSSDAAKTSTGVKHELGRSRVEDL